MKRARTSFLADVTWQSDYEDRMNPELVTRLLHRAVPVLRASNWRVEAIDQGVCTTLLPLNAATTNQHGTHQAALISLSADYTGGIALASLLRGVPIGGVHPPTEQASASLWLASMNVRYLQPSTGHLVGRCEIDDDVAAKVIDRYARGKRTLVTLPMKFESNGQVVAEGDLKYFAQPASQQDGDAGSTSALGAMKLKASARMIAGVRASSLVHASSVADGQQFERLDRPFDRNAAGPHGMLLAEKLKAALPQLSNMVSARTAHGDELIQSVPGVQQVILVGAGLDMRPYRLAATLPGVRYFELDLPEMLVERERVISNQTTPVACDRVALVADFRTDAVDQILHQCDQFDSGVPTAIIYEGCSMYFDQATNAAMLGRLANLMQHPDSRLWVDFVSEDAIAGTSGEPAVNDFLDRMREMGEAFVFGVENPLGLLESSGLTPTSIQSSRDYLGLDGQPDAAAYELYRFVVAEKASRMGN